MTKHIGIWYYKEDDRVDKKNIIIEILVCAVIATVAVVLMGNSA
jgi:hypothetical protein